MKRVQAGLRIPEHLNTKLSELAKNNGISRNALLIQIIQNYLKGETVKKEVIK